MAQNFLPGLVFLVALATISTPVFAQSKKAPDPQAGNYTLSGSSLRGIQQLSTTDAFKNFFTSGTSAENLGASEALLTPTQPAVSISDQTELRLGAPISPDTTSVPVTTYDPFYDTSGVQVQLEVGDR